MAKEKSIAVQGSQGIIAGSTINSQGDVIVKGSKITNIYTSYDYQCLAGQIKELEQDLEDIPLEKAERRLQKSKQLEDLRNREQEFKKEVVRLAETFTRVDINTERLIQAKLYFEQGKIREADAILKVEDISHEQEGLLEAKEQKIHELDHLIDLLKKNSNEFLIKAQITATLFDNPTRFEDTCRYFENAIKSYPNFNNYFEYAFFLAAHNQNNKAVMYYKKAMKEYGQDLDSETRAMTLNNLGNLQKDKNEYEEAQRSYAEALKIYRQIAEDNPQTYLSDLAMTLNNLGALQAAKNEYDNALNSYTEALKIRQRLAEANPQTYLPYVAMTLNNLGVLQTDKNEYDNALNSYTEALKIYRRLAEANPQTYLPDVAMTLNNLGVYYLESQPDRNKSIQHASEAIEILLPMVEKVPYTSVVSRK